MANRGRPALSIRYSLLSIRRSFGRPDHADLAGDAAVVLDAAVAREIEDRLLAEPGRVEVAIGDDQLVVLGRRRGDDLAVRIDDDAAADHVMAVLGAALRHRHHPGRVLVGAGLHRETMVEVAL